METFVKIWLQLLKRFLKNKIKRRIARLCWDISCCSRLIWSNLKPCLYLNCYLFIEQLSPHLNFVLHFRNQEKESDSRRELDLNEPLSIDEETAEPMYSALVHGFYQADGCRGIEKWNGSTTVSSPSLKDVSYSLGHRIIRRKAFPKTIFLLNNSLIW